MRILNLHGLGGSANNRNYRMIRKVSPNAEVVSETIDYENTSPRAIIEKYCHYGDFDIVVGTSFGGFFAYVIGARLRIKTIMTNPCVPPAEYIPQMIDGYKYTAELEELWNTYKNKELKGFVLIAHDDKVLDPNKTFWALSRNGIKITWAKGGHTLRGYYYGWWLEPLVSQRFEFYNDGGETEHQFELNGVIYDLNKIFSDFERTVSTRYRSNPDYVFACPSLVINDKGSILEIRLTDNHGSKGTVSCNINIEKYFSDEEYQKDLLLEFVLELKGKMCS